MGKDIYAAKIKSISMEIQSICLVISQDLSMTILPIEYLVFDSDSLINLYLHYR